MKKSILLLTSLFLFSCGSTSLSSSEIISTPNEDSFTHEESSLKESNSELSSPVLSTSESSSDKEEISSVIESTADIISGIIDGSDNIFLVDIDKTVDFHTPDQRKYLKGSYELIEKYTNGKTECSKPESIYLTWDFFEDGLPEQCRRTFNRFDVFLDVNDTFDDPRIYTLSEGFEDGFKVEVTNLLLDTTYYWKVQAVYENLVVESETSSFKTTNVAPRNLNVDGVSNVRDLGGWKIDDNHRIKQGMIYRGAAFEDLLYDTHITDIGISQARNELKVNSEIELRWISIGEITSRQYSLLGEDINYYEYEFNYNDEKLLDGNIDSIAKCFRLFADESKYPIYYHCRIGTDRTGILTYLLFGFLGLDQDTILKDYLFSNFGYVGGNRTINSIKNAYLDKIDSSEGETLQDKITNILKNRCLLDDDTLNSIKSLMIEEI